MHDQDSSDDEPRRILIVDDDKYLRDFYSHLVKSLGHIPVCVSNGEEALNILGVPGEHFDLALVDLLMPVKTGWELIDAIHKDTTLDELRLMAMTGLPLSVEEYEKVNRVTNAVFLKSDFELAKFAAIVDKLLAEPGGHPKSADGEALESPSSRLKRPNA
jgi:CheY-like chemotaxis protein